MLKQGIVNDGHDKYPSPYTASRNLLGVTHYIRGSEALFLLRNQNRKACIPLSVCVAYLSHIFYQRKSHSLL